MDDNKLTIRTGSERIQWLEDMLPRLGAVGRAPSNTWQVFTEHGTICIANTFREVVDLAMEVFNG